MDSILTSVKKLLGLPADYEAFDPDIIIHHINPITKEDVLEHRECLLDPDNVICVSDRTHKAIHYGDDSILEPVFTERRPGDTCPWRK